MEQRHGCLWVLDGQMARAAEGMNEDLCRLTGYGCWMDRLIELHKGGMKTC